MFDNIFLQMGPPPANLQIIEATRQNWLQMADGDHYRIDSPKTDGGPDTWVWHIVNLGAGALWLRWDGRGYAAANDAHSVLLPAQHGYENFSPQVMTVACQGGASVSFTAENLPLRR